MNSTNIYSSDSGDDMACVNGVCVTQMPSHQAKMEAIMYEYIMGSVCVFGVLGNIMVLLIIYRKNVENNLTRMEKFANAGLAALAVSDLSFCFSMLPQFWVDQFTSCHETRGFSVYYAGYSRGVVNVFAVISTWFTVMVGLGRYLAVCHPLTARRVVGMALARRTFIAIIMAAILTNLPFFLKYTVSEGQICIESQLCSDIEHLCLTDGILSLNKSVEMSFMCYYFAVVVVAPFFVLVFCNFNIIRGLSRGVPLATPETESISSASHGEKQLHFSCESTLNPKDHIVRVSWPSTRRCAPPTVTLTLILIITLHLILVTPAEVLNFFRFIKQDNVSKVEEFNFYLGILIIAQCVNYSVNFLLYCVVDSYFRQIMRSALGCGHHRDIPRLPSPYNSIRNNSSTNLMNTKRCLFGDSAPKEVGPPPNQRFMFSGLRPNGNIAA